MYTHISKCKNDKIKERRKTGRGGERKERKEVWCGSLCLYSQLPVAEIRRITVRDQPRKKLMRIPPNK
jgi:hypothetical protein